VLKFLHAADIHLDSPLRGLERYDTAPLEAIRNACRRALENLVELAIAEEAALVLLAGDLYDGDWKDYNTGLFFTRQVARLRDHGIRVVIVAGNHDAESRITRALRLPDNARILSVKQPETVVLDDLGLAVHGQGYARAAVTDDLAAAFPVGLKGLLNIGLLHTSLNGRPGHAPYAPCSVERLRSKGYAYWALGHVHAREEVCSDPPIIFPGCIQGRHARETGPKGCTLVSVEGSGIASTEHRDLDLIRWSLCTVDLSGAGSTEEALEHAGRAIEAELERAGQRPVIVRLRLTGPSRVDEQLKARPEHWTEELRNLGASLASGELWIERVLLETRPALGLEEALARGDALGRLLRAIQGERADPERIAALARELEPLRAKLPEELVLGDDAIDPTDPEVVAEALGQARELLVSRLLSTATQR